MGHTKDSIYENTQFTYALYFILKPCIFLVSVWTKNMTYKCTSECSTHGKWYQVTTSHKLTRKTFVYISEPEYEQNGRPSKLCGCNKKEIKSATSKLNTRNCKCKELKKEPPKS